MRSIAELLRLSLAVLAGVLALVVQPGAASAHTDVDFTAPADGDTVTEPVDEVTVAFTAPVELVGNGFEALDAQANIRQPSVLSDDGQVFQLLFDPPLAGGGVGIRYEIRSNDGHVLSGSFAFVVDAPVPTTAPAGTSPATTAAPPTEAPVTSAVAPEVTDPAVPESTTTDAATTTASPTTAGTSTTVPPAGADDDGSSNGLILAIVAAVAIGVGGFFLIRSRTSGAS